MGMTDKTSEADHFLGDQEAMVGLYRDSQCGRCGYGCGSVSDTRSNDDPVALIRADEIMGGESLCLRCFAEMIGDRLSATHK